METTATLKDYEWSDIRIALLTLAELCTKEAHLSTVGDDARRLYRRLYNVTQGCGLDAQAELD